MTPFREPNPIADIFKGLAGVHELIKKNVDKVKKPGAVVKKQQNHSKKAEPLKKPIKIN